MQKNRVPKVSFLLVLTVMFALLGSAQAATQEPDPGSIATVTIETDTVMVRPQTQAGFTFTISGPGDFLLQREYPAGGAFAFSAKDRAGKALPDGVYQYEIRTLSQKKLTEQDQAQRGLSLDNTQAPVQSGSFSILDGSFVTQDVVEESAAQEIQAPTIPNDQVILDDLIVDGSICAGQDCVNGESFGFDTIRLKENNLRIRFVDTSSTSSFPSNDWQLTANDSANGGANKFSIDDIDGGKTPFTVEAGAPSNALYVEDDGDIGLGTSTPVVDIDIKEGDTPTIRLDQDGTAGWSPQVWDIAGNEANFFIRDATNGSTLPFRIQPGAPASALTIKSDGDVGMGTWEPSAALHVYRTNDTAQILVQDTGSSAKDLLTLKNAGPSRFAVVNTASSGDPTWRFNHANDGAFRIAADDGDVEFILGQDGNLTINGDYYSTACTNSPCAPDYVFKAGYPLMSLDKLAAFIEHNNHLPNVPSESDLREAGVINNTQFQMILLEKIEELTLYTLQQQQIIEELATGNYAAYGMGNEIVAEKDAQISALQARLTALEQATGLPSSPQTSSLALLPWLLCIALLLGIVGVMGKRLYSANKSG